MLDNIEEILRSLNLGAMRVPRLPELDAQRDQINETIMMHVVDTMGSRLVIQQFVGMPGCMATNHHHQYDHHPDVIRAKLIKQFFVDLLLKGFVLSKDDLRYIEEHLFEIEQVPNFDLYKLAIKTNTVVNDVNLTRDMIIYEIIRLVADNEFWVNRKKDLISAGRG